MQTYSRRRFLGAIGRPAAAFAVATFDPEVMKNALTAISARKGKPEDIAADESYWYPVQQAYTVDRSLVNLNNGGVSPSPAVVQDSMKRYLDYSNAAPVYTMWHILEPQREGVRKRLARAFGCDPEEVALTRNASEGLEICQLGLDLKTGDEILTTNQDYPRMITTFKQRERREGLVLKEFSIPVPAEKPQEIVELFERNITRKTKVILMCHMINLTGQILPVKEVVAMARQRGIPVIVDGAHALAHFDFRLSDLNCDYYATSLHKWLCAPHGTGLLYVRRDKIADLWPMMAAPETMDDDIRKYEEIGTHPAANYLAIADALTFHQGIGAANKEARMRYLRDRWAKRLLKHNRVRLHTSLKPRFACGLATVQVEGIDPEQLTDYLWKKHRIIVTPLKHPEFEGIRVTPNVYTTLDEIDRFSDIMETVIKKGLPES
ncbi:MAG: aminotransferase class V-fold PLP-dependent enzyme [Fidelibacterota bacterium]|nr:MAG: aminotransferase class V-fold PLP-dependent enzyme [Candidatus Neomarinimicrobiota bacterium]